MTRQRPPETGRSSKASYPRSRKHDASQETSRTGTRMDSDRYAGVTLLASTPVPHDTAELRSGTRSAMTLAPVLCHGRRHVDAMDLGLVTGVAFVCLSAAGRRCRVTERDFHAG